MAVDFDLYDTSVYIVSIASIGVYWIISVICTCWLASFIILKHRKEIVSRRPTSSILAGSLTIFGQLIHLPLVMVLLNMTFAPGFEHAPRLTDILSLIGQSAPFHIFTYRAYMVYFDIKWNLAMQDKEWRLHIDPHEKNWFLRHRNTFGNYRLVALILFCHWLLWVIAVVIAGFVFGTPYSRPLLGAPGIISIICDFIIFLKFPKFSDIFGVSDEIKLTLQMEMFGLSLYYIVVTVIEPEYGTIPYALITAVPSITFFGLMMALLYYPLKRFDYPACPCYAKAFFDSIKDEEEFDDEDEEQVDAAKNRKELFKTLMETKHGFKTFARHLTREFCLEVLCLYTFAYIFVCFVCDVYNIQNLLFFVETQQWLLSLRASPGYGRFTTTKCEHLLRIGLHRSTPRSTILTKKEMQSEIGMIEKRVSNQLELISYERELDEVVNANELPTIEEYIQASKIFFKYITNDAYFCINVSHSLRKKLYEVMGFSDKDARKTHLEDCFEKGEYLKNKSVRKEELFGIYNDARQSIYQLLLQSLDRFMKTDEYKALQDKEKV